jgi:hypothetical protein
MKNNCTRAGEYVMEYYSTVNENWKVEPVELELGI